MRAGAVYFALVFSAGFVLGAIRTLWVVPLTGVRLAELLESPIMLAVTVMAARQIVRGGLARPLGAGLIGLGLLLAAEFATAMGLRHLSPREYVASRDPISGTVYVILLAAYAAMPLLLSLRPYASPSGGPSLLDAFIPRPDIQERHEVTIQAPAWLVFDIASHFDMQSIALVRAIFWLRAKLLGARMFPRRQTSFVAEMLALGWGRLAEAPGRYFVAGAACQPWKADVTFSPISSGEFAAFAEPDCVKIAWTLEVESLGTACTRLATETRVVGTDDSARARLRAYWRKFGIGIVMIRRLLLQGVRREAEVVRVRK
jgi:hypothetical protein